MQESIPLLHFKQNDDYCDNASTANMGAHDKPTSRQVFDKLANRPTIDKPLLKADISCTAN